MMVPVQRPNSKAVLETLKDFQQDTVDYVFEKMYGSEGRKRFLIADEVGLGKTLVARGIIARAIDHLWDKVRRIDIVYICSNADIARQNIDRLTLDKQTDFAWASRLTLLPLKMQSLTKNRLNFVSFTPGTSFELASSMGLGKERALLYRLLKRTWKLKGKAPLNVLKGNMRSEVFERLCVEVMSTTIDRSIEKSFARMLLRHVRLEKVTQQETLKKRFKTLMKQFARSNSKPRDRSVWQDRRAIIGELRRILARVCLRKLEPDVIILDEFQRFKYLLHEDNEAAELARHFFDQGDTLGKTAPRILLLSATPYKMFTLANEREYDDHYKDFGETLRFLHNNQEETDACRRLLEAYGKELYGLSSGFEDRLFEIKKEIEKALRNVMVRTERLSSTTDRNGMVQEIQPEFVRLEKQDILTFRTEETIARALDHSSVVEYWKSAPYLFNFMDDNYKLKKDIRFALASRNHNNLRKILSGCKELLLDVRAIRDYAKIDPRNARLRQLSTEVIDSGGWKLLWVPPSLSYYKMSGAFATPELRHLTKRLVFSCWQVVPKVIAAFLSYEAERQLAKSVDKRATNTQSGRKSRSGLLRFAKSNGRLTGLPVLGLIYPSFVLAEIGDPLSLARARKKSTPEEITSNSLIRAISSQIRLKLNCHRSSENVFI